MESTIELSIDKAHISFNLPTLNGKLKCDDLLSLQISPAQKLLELTKVEDPRQPGKENIKSLVQLASIHRKIVTVAKQFDDDKSKVQRLIFSLASIFHIYLFRYELYHEMWGCQMAWLYLLRLQYQTLIELHQSQQISGDDKSKLLDYLTLSLRDWANFCLDSNNHFLFRSSQQIPTEESQSTDLENLVPPLNDIEGEVRAIICPLSSNVPYDFFMLKPRGPHILDRIIANWFLRDRYNWLRAIKLTWYRMKKWLRITLLAITPIILLILFYIGNRWFGLIGTFLLPSYIFLLVLAIASIFLRSIADILLPRLWVGVLVGYLTLITSELWKISNEFSCQRIFWLNVLALSLSVLYLRWEIGNKLARTPEWKIGKLAQLLQLLKISPTNVPPIKRTLVIIIYGWISSLLIGLIILDLVGGYLVPNSIEDCSSMMIPGIFGKIYIKGLFFFAPFALLIGVIVQIFWEEKSITHPIE